MWSFLYYFLYEWFCGASTQVLQSNTSSNSQIRNPQPKLPAKHDKILIGRFKKSPIAFSTLLCPIFWTMTQTQTGDWNDKLRTFSPQGIAARHATHTCHHVSQAPAMPYTPQRLRFGLSITLLSQPTQPWLWEPQSGYFFFVGAPGEGKLAFCVVCLTRKKKEEKKVKEKKTMLVSGWCCSCLNFPKQQATMTTTRYDVVILTCWTIDNRINLEKL